ncbi:MAG TPA: cytochrome c3 family protein [Pyrinomonadaceae bacterium]|nr:cytochrome c3 family protein [Pyrinomonadaceae bacterium]
MKIRISALVIILIGGLFFAVKSDLKTLPLPDRQIPETIVLAEKAMLGKVTFKHQEHISRKVEGMPEVTCVSCHHVEQPAAEAAKTEGHKTAYPADRTVTLTAANYTDGTAPEVTKCQSCHLAKGASPSILKEAPSMTVGGKTTVLNNQNALHSSCADCHEAALKVKADLKAPKGNQCMQCHKKG